MRWSPLLNEEDRNDKLAVTLFMHRHVNEQAALSILHDGIRRA